MAEAKKEKPVKGITPKGVALFPWLNRADEYKGQRNYKVTLRLSEEDAAPLVEQFTKLADKSFEDTKAELEAKVAAEKGEKKVKAKQALEKLTVNYPFTYAVDEEGDQTGEVDFKFKSAAEFKDKKTDELIQRKIPLFDAKRNPTKVNIFGGAVLRVAYLVKPYYVPGQNMAGISLRIDGVQVISPGGNNGGGGSASRFGFSEEEGYESDEDESSTSHGDSESAGSDDTTDEDEDF